MAVGEKHGISGKDYLTAVVTGYEGYVRIAMAVQPSAEYILSGRNWGLVSWQIFAASLTAAKVMGFNADQVEQTLGASLYNAMVAANKHAVGLAKSDIYHFQHGWCARNGVVSAELTKMGFDNCYGALDGPNGFWRKVSDREDATWYQRGLGSEWFIMDTYLKHWPANMWVQTPLEAMDALMKESPFTLDEVEKIRVSPIVPFICGDYSQTTKSTLDAQFSIPYCLTAYILNPQMGAHWFSKQMRHDDKLANASKMFEFFGETRTPNDNFDEFKKRSFPECTVEIMLKNGKKLTKTMRYPKGHPRNNFSMNEIYDHFRMCCNNYIPENQINRIIETVDQLENLPDIGLLASLCVTD
jgi:2-methylcitrate dehydratase PrpD